MIDRHAAWGLRPELLLRTGAVGEVDVLDTLFEQVHRFSPAEVRALDLGLPGAVDRLEAALLREGPVSAALRDRAWAARLRPRPWPAPAAPAGPHLDAACERLAKRWSGGSFGRPERWRRLLEGGLAGGRRLQLDGLLSPRRARALASATAGLRYAPLRTGVVSAERAALPARAPFTGLRDRLLDPDLHALLGAALDRPTAGVGLHLNAWRLQPGDHMALHADGPRYEITVVIGLCEGWRAEDGGEISFIDPTRPEGPRQPWLPHLGDALVFAPDAGSWHAVVPPRRTRHTLSGWLVRPSPEPT